MEQGTFTAQMSKAAIETQSEIDDATYALYWERFKEWTNDEFTTSIDKCCRTLNRFPSVAMVYKHKPVDQSTGELERFRIEQSSLAICYEPSSKPIEEVIDDMTTEEVSERFRVYMDLGKPNADWLAMMFEKHKRKGIIRRCLADAIEHLENPNGLKG